MKHSKSILKTLFVLTPLILSSCNLLPTMTPSGRKRSSEESSSINLKCSHSWTSYETTKEATCTEDGEQERYCTKCGESQIKVIKAGHKWGSWVVTRESTCVVQGQEERECTVCHTIEERLLTLTDHSWVEDVVIQEPTCTEAGVIRYVCSVCQETKEETIRALGHTYAADENGEDIVTWNYEPTCTEAGEGTKQCLRCDYVEYIYSDPLGHDIHLVDDGVEPEEGKAKVRLYECSRCGVASLGFKANEVSAASRDHLMFFENGNEVGARFWGRPIGNAMPLDDEGSASSSNHEGVFDPTVEGDFFEYIFDLTTEQANALSECYCYCDAQPAAYLARQDFWACDPSAEEWTQGYYIEDNPNTPEDEYGQPITDYRYILYVDDEPQQFDPSILVPVGGSYNSEPRQEYIMPYLFHLHQGTNKISLRMAGGYRSIFYNFIFRPVGM